MLRRMFLMGGVALSLTACQTPDVDPVVISGATADTTVFLVRHAEKQEGPDPSLTAAGIVRAEALAERLADVGLTEIYSTNYARTRETAEAVSKATGVKVSLYDPSYLPGFSESLMFTAGRVLVVGHSNTTPGLVTLLGGDAGAPIDDASEFNRLYTVEIFADRTATSQETYGD